MSSSETRLSERLQGLDALRGTALLLGVVLHASMSYFPVTIWIAPDTDNSPVASALFFAIHLFRMSSFFLIAATASPGKSLTDIAAAIDTELQTLADAKGGDHFQFERLGYFFADPVDSKTGKPVCGSGSACWVIWFR